MSQQLNSQKPSTSEQILDLLLAALQERQAAHQAGVAGQPQPAPATPPSSSLEQAPSPAEAVKIAGPISEPAAPQTPRPTKPSVPILRRQRPPQPGEEGWEPPAPLPIINLNRTLIRLLIILVAIIVLINIPLNSYGTSLARMVPNAPTLVIRDGLVMKGSGPEIYVLQDNKRRWISSLEAFHFYHYRWSQVHTVDDSFLQQFELGKPIHVLLKCANSPHIYALEDGKKRWIKDIPTFEAEGYVWEDVKSISCYELRQLPDGKPIPEDAGPSPRL